ncbi:hydrophobin-domain-containing protein [Pilatotrama ljubarskyi]|nr:hydrophobin-domain-containing protein [Pilatotrama ljubarskyi]
MFCRMFYSCLRFGMSNITPGQTPSNVSFKTASADTALSTHRPSPTIRLTRIMQLTATKLLTTFALAILAVATPIPAPSDDGVGNGSSGACGTNPLQCCQLTMPANSTIASALLGAVGVAAADVTTLVGIACTPIDGIGVGGSAACSAHTVCCANEGALAGLISLSCLPVL